MLIVLRSFQDVMICIVGFAILYTPERKDFLEFITADGSVDTNIEPKRRDVFWFSMHTFIPAIELLNARRWQPKHGCKFYRSFMSYSTLATIESILGLAMIPSLLTASCK